MNEQLIWLQAYTVNVQQGIPHTEACKHADEVIKKITVLNK